MSAAQPLANQPMYPSAELIHGLQPRPDSISAARHEEIVRRVMECYRACKADQPRVPAAYQPGGEWADYLAERQGVYDGMLAGDSQLVSDKLRGFWRNELGPIVKEYAKYEQLTSREAPFLERFETNVRRNFAVWRSIHEHDARVLDVPEVGNPWGLMIDGRLVVPKATRYHALSSQIGELCRGTGRPLVAEIGAGYGGQAYFLLRDYPGTTYVDFDLPETLMLAAYYLMASLPDREIVLYGESHRPLDEVLTGADAVLMPNFALPKLADRSVDLFLNTFSFSEMPMGTLSEYLTQVQRSLKRFLLLNNMDRTGVVNRGFERIPASRYPLDHSRLRCIYRKFDLFHGHQGDYREFLYEVI